MAGRRFDRSDRPVRSGPIFKTLVMDMEEDIQVPLLLGRPFLDTKVALIDVKKGELTLRVGEEVVHFNLNESLKQFDCDNAECKIVE